MLSMLNYLDDRFPDFVLELRRWSRKWPLLHTHDRTTLRFEQIWRSDLHIDLEMMSISHESISDVVRSFCNRDAIAEGRTVADAKSPTASTGNKSVPGIGLDTIHKDLQMLSDKIEELSDTTDKIVFVLWGLIFAVSAHAVLLALVKTYTK